MPKFLVDWSINGTTEVDAASKDQAQIVFEQISKRELIVDGDLEVHCEPETKEERECAWELWRAAIRLKDTDSQCTGTAQTSLPPSS